MESLSGELEVNGETLRLGNVLFKEPSRFRILPGRPPFVDAEGGRYVLPGRGQEIKAVFSAKKGISETVLCRKAGDGGEGMRFGYDGIF